MSIFTRKYLTNLLHEEFENKNGICKLAFYETMQDIQKTDMILIHNLRKLDEEQLKDMLKITNEKLNQREKLDGEYFIVIYDQFNPIAAIRKERTDLLRQIMKRINQDSDTDYINTFELKTRTIFEAKKEILSRYEFVDSESDVENLDIY